MLLYPLQKLSFNSIWQSENMEKIKARKTKDRPPRLSRQYLRDRLMRSPI
jgi:hypothetical protein